MVVAVVGGVCGGKEVATVAAAGAESRDALRKPFLQISCDSRLARVASRREREVLLHPEQRARFNLSIQGLPGSI